MVEAELKIIVQATAFARVFFSTYSFKKWNSKWLPRNRVFLNHPNGKYIPNQKFDLIISTSR